MITILNCWRQFGRRYLWPHFLLGMAAASLALPGGEQRALVSSVAAVHNSGIVAHLNNFALWQQYPRHLAKNINNWHRHAISKVISHLSLRLASYDDTSWKIKAQPVPFAKLALPDTLNILLPDEAPALAIKSGNFQPTHRHRPGDTANWLATVVGIRAGPDLLGQIYFILPV